MEATILKTIRDLKPGDIVDAEDGRFEIQSVRKEHIIEGDVWNVIVSGGESAGLYDGGDKVEVLDRPNGQ